MPADPPQCRHLMGEISCLFHITEKQKSFIPYHHHVKCQYLLNALKATGSHLQAPKSECAWMTSWYPSESCSQQGSTLHIADFDNIHVRTHAVSAPLKLSKGGALTILFLSLFHSVEVLTKNEFLYVSVLANGSRILLLNEFTTNQL